MLVMQIGMNTADMAGSLRLFSEVFGFVNAGGQGLWGPLIRIQSLEETDRAIMWWLLGRQPEMQLELFHHTRPKQRPVREDWRPSDHGWVRFGVAVPDFDRALAALARNGIGTFAPPIARDGLRRASFRDPFVGCVIEVLEDGPGLPYLSRGDGSLPAIVYATSSVADLESARFFYEEALGMALEPLEQLHQSEDEASWGLAGAERSGFIAHFGGVRLEIVRYQTPVGRPKPDDYRNSDQGIVNVGLRARDSEEAIAAFDRLALQGVVPRHRGDGEGTVGGYITDPGRELEIVALPDAVADIVGFKPVTPFLPALL